MSVGHSGTAISVATPSTKLLVVGQVGRGLADELGADHRNDMPDDVDEFDVIVLAEPSGDPYPRVRAWRTAGHRVGVVVWRAQVVPPDDRALLQPLAVVHDGGVPAVIHAIRQLGVRSSAPTIPLRAGSVDLERGVFTAGDDVVRLTRLEVDLLAYLSARAGKDVDRDELQRQVWGHRGVTSSRAVDMAVSRLRRKIELDPSDPDHLITRRGGGYRFALDIPAPAGVVAPPPRRARRDIVGRDALLAEVQACLDRGARLVTLLGPPGAGKTTVATEFVRRHTDDIVLVELAPVREPADVLLAVAGSLGLDTGRGSDPQAVQAQLARVLGQRGAVVVLDNAEHLVDAVADVVSDWLGHEGQGAFVVTSQVKLSLVDEVVLDVLPLRPNDARRLFMQRSRDAGARLSDDDPALDEVLGLLDGVPLALDLAAARVPSLGLSGLAEALRSGRSVLRDRSRDRPARHASLDRALDLAWERLDAVHQEALARLAVFRGTFDWRGADAILGSSDHGPDSDELVDELIHRSLLYGDSGRLRVLAPIGQYAIRRGDPSVVVDARARHAAWIADLGTERAQATFGPDAVRAFDDLVALAGDLVAAASFARDRADLDTWSRVALVLDRVWALRAHLQRRIAALGDLIAETAAAGRDDLRVPLLRCRGLALLDAGQIPESIADLEQAIAMATAPEQAADRIQALLVLGDVRRNAGDLDASLEAARLAHRAAVELGDAALIDEARAKLIHVAHFTRTDDAGPKPAVELAAIRSRAEASGRIDFALKVQLHMATVLYNEGDRAALRAARMRLLELQQALPNRRSEPMVRCHLGIGLMQDERYVDAGVHLEAAVRQLEASGRPLRASLLAYYRALNLLQQRRWAEALADFVRHREALAAGGARRGEAHAWEGVALTHLDQGDTATAAMALDEATARADGSQDKVLLADSNMYLAVCDVVDGRCDRAADRLDALDLNELPADHRAFALAARGAAAAGQGADIRPWLARFDEVAARPGGIAFSTSLQTWRQAVESDRDALSALTRTGGSVAARLLARVWHATR